MCPRRPTVQRQLDPAVSPQHDRRWLILVIIGIAQLMVVLDVTIVNIALPSAQRDLGFSDDDRQWVITAYALAFGSLLLLGGRIADLFSRKWTFVVGLLLGGALTEVVDWRWCLYVSIVFALPAAIAGTRLLHHVPATSRSRLDVP